MPGADAADVAGAHQQLVAGHLGVGRVLAKGAQEHMDAIEEGGTFDFTYKSCFTDFVPGTYEVRAFYTPTAGSSADDYLIGTPITVTIVP
jgi:hypothetical protein